MKCLRYSSAFLTLVLVQTVSAAIFGVDDRTFVLPNSPSSVLAQSVAVAVLTPNRIPVSKDFFDLDVDSASSLLCADEKFFQSQTLSYACTGFLVGPDLLVTAGHCSINTGAKSNFSDGYCEVFSWYFGYEVDEVGQFNPRNRSESDRYSCKEVLFASDEEEPPFRDWSLIRLDRAVKGRTPLRLRPSPPPAGSASLMMIGHPMGLPKVIAQNGRVLFNDQSHEQLISNIDAADGNSGSPVFDSEGFVVGILVGGTPQPTFVEDPVKSCRKVHRCDEDGKNCTLPDLPKNPGPSFQRTGSEIQKLHGLIELLEQLSRSTL